MKERLLNILDQSTCLTRRQMKDYLGGAMLPEEIHAAETHIASCPLCNMAVEGFETNTEAALEAIAGLNSGFLKEHFDSITPQIHLNSIAPAVSVPHHHSRKKTVPFPFLKVAAVAAALFVGFGVFWLMDRSKNSGESRMIASNEPAIPASSVPEPPVGDKKNKPSKGNEVDKKQPETKAAAATQVATLADDKPEAQQVAEAAVSAPAHTDEVAAAPMALKRNDNKDIAADDEEEEVEKVAIHSYADSLSDARKAVAALAKSKNQDLKYSEAAPVNNQANWAAAKPPAASMKKAKAPEGEDQFTEADGLYGKGNYKAALAKYNTAMKSGSRNRRAEATVMAAKCYRNMGEKTKAIALLEGLISEGGAQQQTAKRMLEELKSK